MTRQEMSNTKENKRENIERKEERTIWAQKINNICEKIYMG